MFLLKASYSLVQHRSCDCLYWQGTKWRQAEDQANNSPERVKRATGHEARLGHARVEFVFSGVCKNLFFRLGLLQSLIVSTLSSVVFAQHPHRGTKENRGYVLYTHLQILDHEWRFLIRIRLKRVTHVQEAELWRWIGLMERLYSGQCAGLTDADHLVEGIFAEIDWCDADSPAMRVVLVAIYTHMSLIAGGRL